MNAGVARERISNLLFYGTVLLLAYLLYLLFRPFLTRLAWAAILAALFHSSMAFFSLLPIAGPWIVWVPSALWLLLTGSVGRAVTLIAIGAGVVGLVDNFLRPFLLSGRSQLNGLLVFISLLGGITAFGFLGLVLGPVIMATAIGVLDAYTKERREHPRGAITTTDP